MHTGPRTDFQWLQLQRQNSTRPHATRLQQPDPHRRDEVGSHNCGCDADTCVDKQRNPDAGLRRHGNRNARNDAGRYFPVADAHAEGVADAEGALHLQVTM